MAPLNPVLRRELKERMRAGRTGPVLTAYLAVLAVVLYGLYTNAEHRPFGGLDPLGTANIGRGMFESLLLAVLLLVCFLVPGYTAGAIVGERERQTLIPMQVTLLPARSIVLGKLLASLAYLCLLVVATIPLLAASFLFGGVTLAELLKGIGMVLVTGVVLAAISLAVSSLAKRSQTATVLAYGITLLLVLGTLAFYGFEHALSTRPGGQNKAVLVMNPLVATSEVVAGNSAASGTSSPLTSIRRLLHDPPVFDSVGPIGVSSSAVEVPRGGVAQALLPGPAPGPGRQPPYAAYSLAGFALLTLVSLAVAVRRIRTPGVGGGA